MLKPKPKKPLSRDVQKKVLNFFSKEGFWKNLKPFINQDEKQQKQLAFNDWPSNYPGHKHLLLSLGLMEKVKTTGPNLFSQATNLY